MNPAPPVTTTCLRVMPGPPVDGSAPARGSQRQVLETRTDAEISVRPDRHTPIIRRPPDRQVPLCHQEVVGPWMECCESVTDRALVEARGLLLSTSRPSVTRTAMASEISAGLIQRVE